VYHHFLPETGASSLSFHPTLKEENGSFRNTETFQFLKRLRRTMQSLVKKSPFKFY
jgi:hypothetical protein